MDLEHHYEPCFQQIPANATERWTLLREFVSRWHNLDLPLTRDCEFAARDAEYTLNRKLPNSIREWIAFANDLMTVNEFGHVFRDDYEVSRLNRLSATTILLQCEGDVYWGIQDQYTDHPDPPVDSYLRDADSPRFHYLSREAPTLTSFALGHLAHFLGGGYVRQVEQSFVSKMNNEFPVVSQFDDLRIFEMVDLISFLQPDSEDKLTLIVASKPPLNESEMPECLRRMIPSKS